VNDTKKLGIVVMIMAITCYVSIFVLYDILLTHMPFGWIIYVIAIPVVAYHWVRANKIMNAAVKLERAKERTHEQLP
jgi:multisubunit Na+/H+ antiporter MnhG subunit